MSLESIKDVAMLGGEFKVHSPITWAYGVDVLINEQGCFEKTKHWIQIIGKHLPFWLLHLQNGIITLMSLRCWED